MPEPALAALAGGGAVSSGGRSGRCGRRGRRHGGGGRSPVWSSGKGAGPGRGVGLELAERGQLLAELAELRRALLTLPGFQVSGNAASC